MEDTDDWAVTVKSRVSIFPRMNLCLSTRKPLTIEYIPEVVEYSRKTVYCLCYKCYFVEKRTCVNGITISRELCYTFGEMIKIKCELCQLKRMCKK